MSDLHAAITERIDEWAREAEGVLALFDHPVWPAQKHEIRRAKRDLRGLAEDRDILARHKAIEWYEGDVGCWYCSGEDDASHRAVEWPCPDVLSLARRLGVAVPAAEVQDRCNHFDRDLSTNGAILCKLSAGHDGAHRFEFAEKVS